MLKRYAAVMKQFNQGYSLIEVLISILILTFTIVSVTKMQLVAIRHTQDTYAFNFAENQIQTLFERFMLGTAPSVYELQQWNKENQQLLSEAKGSITGKGPYKIAIHWHGRDKGFNYQDSLIVPLQF